ncbi:MAG TPA: response regulator transcription factor, partial [Gammaproteobacteria bacterium]|nr:response regulator transcription factor [Gammaproteobacteria bacterium]
MRVLIIEDDAETAAQLGSALEGSGHRAEHVADGDTGLTRARAGGHDALIVDRMLPGLDGLSLVRALRAEGNRVPVLFLTALDQVDERVSGLEGGGDDYLVKPFAFNELLARLQALLRRREAPPADTRLKVADLELDRLKREVRRGGKLVPLQAREFLMLEYLMLHAGQVVTRAMLLQEVWGY